MLTQPDDLAPEAFQTMYQQYNLQYLDDFSDAFFKTNMMEEWFQERYNPEKIIEMAKDNSEWAASESEAIKKSLLENTVATVSAMCLDPPIPYPAELIATGIVKPPLPAKPRADSVDEKQEDAAAEEEEEGKKPADSGVKDTPTEVDSSPISKYSPLRHLYLITLMLQ